jgi:hypothetical protein
MMRVMLALLIGLVPSASMTTAQAYDEGSPDLAALADRYCIAQNGDHVMTWALATHDGFEPLAPDAFGRLRLPGARQLRGFTKTIEGREVRVLTAYNRITGMGEAPTYFHICWVSAEPLDRRPVEASFQHEYRSHGFRQEGARMFIWAPLADGSYRNFGRRDWQRQAQALPREEGARLLMVNNRERLVSVTFMVSVTDCEDWCY